jgi:hypothetical protein
VNAYPPTNGSYGYNSQWSSSNSTAQLVSPLTLIPEQDFRQNARKRSLVDDAEEPVAKRVTRSTVPTTNVPTKYNQGAPARPRLPVPNLTISTSQPTHMNYNGITSFPQNAPLLPPLNGRAMSAVFPTTPTWTPPVSNLTPNGSSSQHGTQTHTQYGTPSRRHSPRSVQDLLSLLPSPVNGSFPGPNSGHISPSVFYQHRNSPYKPVRHVNTLLYPPPSASMHEYAANANQMHYQPLGKRHDYRSGVVPEYGHHTQSWPVLPQPNFNS